MSDAVTITIELVIKPELAEKVFAGLPAMVEESLDFPGFRTIRVMRHKDEPNRALVIEEWDSEQDYKDYQAWRTERGDIAANEQMLLSYRSDIWPLRIAGS